MKTQGNIQHEKELLRQISTGDEQAFKQLFLSYAPFLEPTLTKLVKNKTAAEDLLQEVFLRIWLYRDQLISIENPRSWILRIVYNRAFSYLAGENKYRGHLEALPDTATAPDPEEMLFYNNIRRLVGEAVEQLPAQQKKIYQLSREHGMRAADIAAQLNLSPQTVKNTLGRAVQGIRGYLEAAGYTVPVFLLTFFFRS